MLPDNRRSADIYGRSRCSWVLADTHTHVCHGLCLTARMNLSIKCVYPPSRVAEAVAVLRIL